MVETTMPLVQVQLAAALGAVYTAPAQPTNCVVYVDAIWICNTDAATRAVTLRYGTGTLTAANSLLEAAPFPANHTMLLDGDKLLTLKAGDKLEGLADVAAKVTVTVHGRLVE